MSETPRTWTLIRGLREHETVVLRADGALLRDEEIVEVIEKAPVDAEIEQLSRERDDLYSQVVGSGILASDADEAEREAAETIRCLRGDLDEALDELQDALTYVPEYFIEKWDMLAVLRKHGRVKSADEQRPDPKL